MNLGPGPWCGTSGGYTNHQCRCDACRAAWTSACSRSKANRVASYDGSKCGKYTTYNNYGCRCDACRRAWADHQAARRAAS